MKVNVNMKIEILDSEEAGRTFHDSFIRETETQHTEYGVIDRLEFGWQYLHPEHPMYIHEHTREEDSQG